MNTVDASIDDSNAFSEAQAIRNQRGQSEAPSSLADTQADSRNPNSQQRDQYNTRNRTTDVSRKTPSGSFSKSKIG